MIFGLFKNVLLKVPELPGHPVLNHLLREFIKVLFRPELSPVSVEALQVIQHFIRAAIPKHRRSVIRVNPTGLVIVIWQRGLLLWAELITIQPRPALQLIPGTSSLTEEVIHSDIRSVEQAVHP